MYSASCVPSATTSLMSALAPAAAPAAAANTEPKAKVAVVTGANRGIGLSIVKLLSKIPDVTVIGTA